MFQESARRALCACEFFVAQTLLAWANVYSNSVIRRKLRSEQCGAFRGTLEARKALIAMFFVPHAPDA